MLAERQPRAVVAGEQHRRVRAELLHADRIENAADRLVDLLDHVAVHPAGGLARERIGPEQRDVRQRVGDIQEERLLAAAGPGGVALDVLDRPLRVPLGDRRLIGRLLQHRGGRGLPVLTPLRLHERHVELPPVECGERVGRLVRVAVGPGHVVGVRDAGILVEAVRGRQELRQVPEVPLADHAGRIARVVQQRRDGRFGLRQPFGTVREVHAPLAGQPVADRQPAGQQRRPRRRADRGGDVAAGELRPFGRHAVQLRRADRRMPEAAEVAIAEVVAEDDHERRPDVRVGLPGRILGGCRNREPDHEQTGPKATQQRR